MTRVFIYEYLTGGGMLSADEAQLPSSLLREGTAMVHALASDFSKLSEVEVLLMQDFRLPIWNLPGCVLQRVDTEDSEWETFRQLAQTADWTIVIAPEFDSILVQRVRALEGEGRRLLGPGAAVVRLCADKHATAEQLRRAGVPAPAGVVFSGSEIPDAVGFPAVIKPRFGAGSQNMRLVRDLNELRKFLARCNIEEEWRVERFHRGLPASVAVLCGPAGFGPLIPCTQHLSNDGNFQYCGGKLPLEERFAIRARNLALRAIGALNRPFGYLGVDLSLGEDPSGDEDVVVEINPRLTTSYVGARAVAKRNLASAMLAIAEGRSVEIDFEDVPLEFHADGTIHRGSIGTAS